jgi:hypothetical protein
MRLAYPLIFLIAVALATGASAAEPRDAVPLDGKPFAGELIAADAEWNLTFRVGQDERKLAAAELVAWGSPVEPKGRTKLDEYFPPAEVLLADGGLLVADLKESKGDALLLVSDLLGSLEVPRAQVRGMLFSPPLNRARRDELAKRLLEAGQTDRLILHNGDVVAGGVRGFVQASGEGQRQFLVEVAVGAAAIKVAADRVAGISFAGQDPKGVGEDQLRALVGFRDGTRLLARRLEVAGDQVVMRGGADQTWKAPRAELVYLQPLGGKPIYVSDLLASSGLDDSGEARGTPVGRPPREKSAFYKHVPLLSATWPYYADLNVRGGHLRAGGRLWLKGIGMHSGGALTVALPQACKRFEADVALDDSVGQRGSVVFEVKVYGRQEGRIGVLRSVTSPTIRGGAAPVPVSVDLEGAVGVSLAVLFAERGDELDHANWLNARLVP